MTLTEEKFIQVLQDAYQFGDLMFKANGDILDPEYLEKRDYLLQNRHQFNAIQLTGFLNNREENNGEIIYNSMDGYTFFSFVFLGKTYYAVSFGFGASVAGIEKHKNYLDSLVVLNSMKCGIKTLACIVARREFISIVEEDYSDFQQKFSFIPVRNVFEGRKIAPRYLLARWGSMPQQPRFLILEISQEEGGFFNSARSHGTDIDPRLRGDISMSYDEYVEWKNSLMLFLEQHGT